MKKWIVALCILLSVLVFVLLDTDMSKHVQHKAFYNQLKADGIKTTKVIPLKKYETKNQTLILYHYYDDVLVKSMLAIAIYDVSHDQYVLREYESSDRYLNTIRTDDAYIVLYGFKEEMKLLEGEIIYENSVTTIKIEDLFYLEYIDAKELVEMTWYYE